MSLSPGNGEGHPVTSLPSTHANTNPRATLDHVDGAVQLPGHEGFVKESCAPDEKLCAGSRLLNGFVASPETEQPVPPPRRLRDAARRQSLPKALMQQQEQFEKDHAYILDENRNEIKEVRSEQLERAPTDHLRSKGKGDALDSSSELGQKRLANSSTEISEQNGSNLSRSLLPTVLHLQRRNPMKPHPLLDSPSQENLSAMAHAELNEVTVVYESEISDKNNEILMLMKRIQHLEEAAFSSQEKHRNFQAAMQRMVRALEQQIKTSQAEAQAIFDFFSMNLDLYTELHHRQDSEIVELKQQIRDLKWTYSNDNHKQSGVQEAMRKMIMTLEAEQVLLSDLHDSYVEKLEGSAELLFEQVQAASRAVKKRLSEAKAHCSSEECQLRTKQVVQELADFRSKHQMDQIEIGQLQDNVAMLAQAHAELQTACGHLEEERLALKSQNEDAQQRIGELQRLCKRAYEALQAAEGRQHADEQDRFEEHIDERRTCCTICNGNDPEKLIAEDDIHRALHNQMELIELDLAMCGAEIERSRESQKRQLAASLQENNEEIRAVKAECQSLKAKIKSIGWARQDEIRTAIAAAENKMKEATADRLRSHIQRVELLESGLTGKLLPEEALEDLRRDE